MSPRKSSSSSPRAGGAKTGAKAKGKLKTKAAPSKAAGKSATAKPTAKSPARQTGKAGKAGKVSKVSKLSKQAADDDSVWTLRLYVTGRGERSDRAIRNLQTLCKSNLAEGAYKIEVIDLMKHPEMAKADEILAIPTLVRKLPEPMKRIIGDLSNADRAMLSLDFPKLNAP
ncbi:MAG: circadian clock KaiB family protein [Polyangiales bacterium]